MQRDESAILDIARSARLVLEFTRGMGFAGFQNDEKTGSAVLHQLMVIGEAVKRLSSEFRQAHKEVPWTVMAGMRDKLIHAYDEVDVEEVWRTVTRDIPDLLAYMRRQLPQVGES